MKDKYNSKEHSFDGIIEHKEMEKALRESQGRYEALLKALPVGLFQTNADGFSVYSNEQTSKITGLPPDELTELKWTNAIHPDDREKVIDEWKRCVKDQKVFKMEYRFQHPDGAISWVIGQAAPFHDYSGNLLGYVGTLSDITENKQAEKALRLSEERFSKTFSGSPNVMSILAFTNNFTDGRFVDVNEIFTRITGYSREEVIGRTTSELDLWVEPGDLAMVTATILKQKEIRNQEIKFRIKSGEIKVGLLSAAIIDFDGKPSMLLNVNDITERKQFEKEIALLDRLNLIGEMAAGIGHEIRNPMTTVRGFLQMLGAKEECTRFKEYFKLMIEELDRANSIITEFLSLAKNKAITLKEQDLNSIIGAVAPLIQADAVVSDKEVKFELEEIPGLLLDEKEIRQLILNLVRNGLEAMSPGGCLTIRTFVDKKKVVLSVQDKGKGIKPDVMEKVGTPFFTTKEHGTGLGLAVCYSIAARHNAVIRIKTSSRGTTFFVEFKPPQRQQQLW